MVATNTVRQQRDRLRAAFCCARRVDLRCDCESLTPHDIQHWHHHQDAVIPGEVAPLSGFSLDILERIEE